MCKRANTCTVPGCTGRYHHTLLHNPKASKEVTPQRVDQESACDTQTASKDMEPCTSASLITCNNLSLEGVYLCVVPVKVQHEGKTVLTYAFLDQGSTHSLCDTKLVQALGVSGREESMTFQTLGHPATSCRGVSLTLSVSSLDGLHSVNLPNVFSIGNIPINPNVIPAKGVLNTMPHLSGITFQRIPHATVTLLIGADVPEVFCPIDVRKGGRGQPIAFKSILGWSLLGPSLSSSRSSNCSVNFITHSEKGKEIEQLVQTLWSTDFGDGTSVFDQPYSREDKAMLKLLDDTIKLTPDRHYQLPLPWQTGVKNLPNNKEMALRRLLSLKRRLTKDVKLKTRYAQTMHDYVSNNYASEITECKEERSDSLRWYLPHHPVTHPFKPEKVRVVFDCSAKYKGVSLNNLLMPGPSLTNNLFGVLARFRKEQVALIGDIQAMFHQIRVHPKHCNALSFLWWPNGNLEKEPVVHRMQVHLFGATSSPSCASYCLRRVVVDFGNEHLPITSEIVTHNFYVDDCLMSFQSAEKAIEVMRDLAQLLQKGGFHLTKWLTNSSEVFHMISESKRAKEMQTHDIPSTQSHRVLGVQWNFDEDSFLFSVSLPDKPLTRRGLLSAVSSLFDPLGFVSPVTLIPKLLLQELCKKGRGWDQDLEDEEAKCWKKWLLTLPTLNHLRIQRCFKPPEFGEVKNCEIHVFSDASLHCYGSCCYLRLINCKDKIHCSFVIGKARVAPIKAVSIPRLELTAAVLSVRLCQIVQKELNLPNCRSVYWTDSTAVLQIIHNETKRFPIFVANRVVVINEHTEIKSWKYVPSKLNPADFATRGIPANQLNAMHPWLIGPNFLWQPVEEWPENPCELPDIPLSLVKEQKQKTTVFLTKSISQDLTGDVLNRLIERCSSLLKAKKLTAWLIRTKQFLWNKVRCGSTVFNAAPFSAEELKSAELELVKHIQRKNFPFLFSAGSAQLPRASSLPRYLNKLCPIIRNGVVRVGGRLKRANLDHDLKHPAILPSDWHFTELVIRQYHCEVGHSGINHTWSAIRQRYWILKGGAAVRRTIGQCTNCKKRNAPVGKQLMADLPSARLQIDQPPFSHVGVDYFGPFQVKQGRALVKRYGCVFTCMTVRAIHIEVSHSLTTDSFLCALRRFISRRGKPIKIYSDCGTNFVGAAKVLQDNSNHFDHERVQNFLSEREIEWSFNPPTASHMGGAWERMIRSIRRILTALMTTQTLTDEVLTTLMAEVEGIINSRPLVPVTMDSKNDDPLTPNHLLLLHGNPNLPPGLFEKGDCYGKRRWAQVQYLAEQFWSRWIGEFLPNLMLRQKWFKTNNNLQVDDVVLLVESMQHRSKWLMGRVTAVFPDKKGKVRTVAVHTKNGTIVRPITKLCIILNKDTNSQSFD